MAETLAERQAQILRAIVREFIRTGEPVGSKHLVDRIRLDISAATVRNEMARLEELGYLSHPHTSAGRMPTDAGYRFVVDGIKRPRPLASGQQRAIEEELGSEAGSIDELLRRAGDVLSRFTRHAAALLALRSRASVLRRIEMFRVGPGRVSVMAIAENGRIAQRMLSVDDSLTEDEVRVLGERLSESLRGEQLDQIGSALRAREEATPPRERAVLGGVDEIVQELLDAERHVVIGGVANLASEEDFEREALHKLYEALEQQTAVMELLANTLDEKLTVRIGGELNDADLSSCSIVMAPFGPAASARGAVGVIGPMRMDYERVIATASAVARLIEHTLGGDETP